MRVKARGEREGSGLGIPNSYPNPIPQPGAQREGVEGIPREQLGAKPGRGRLVGTVTLVGGQSSERRDSLATALETGHAVP